MTHTPGPWTADNGRVYTDLLDDNGDNLMVATCRSNIRLLKEKKRNAVIMAASLEMLEALEGAKWLIESYVSDLENSEEYRDICRVMKKARGEE